MKVDADAADKLRFLLAKPVMRSEDSWELDDGEAGRFDPWDLFDHAIYGSYSSDFDDMAILVLDNIVNGRWGSDHGEGLAHEMFREMLCCANLCDYGTSPRGCFPNGYTRDLLPALLAKWREYREVEWGE